MSVCVLLSRFMAPCHCIAALSDKVVTFTFLHLKKFAIAKKENFLIKQNMKQKTFGFYFFQKSK